MFWRSHTRQKDSQERRCRSVVENIRVPGRRSSCQKPSFVYLGELNDAQHAARTHAGSVLDEVHIS